MGNQFNDRVSPDLLKTYLERGAQRDKIAQYVAQVDAVPGMCLLPDGPSYLYLRVSGKTRKMGVRSLVYYAMRGKSPVFWPCPCKNVACINPHHQNGTGL